MPWCPKCKNEYRAGITVCPDCKEALVDELTESITLDFVPLFQTDNEELKNKLVKYLIHCGRKVQEESSAIETEEGTRSVYAIFVPKADYQEAIQEIRTVISYDAKLEAGEEEDLKPRNRTPEPSTVYVDAKSRYQEYKSSGIMFLVFAVLFFIFGIMNVSGMVTIMANTVSLILIFGTAIAFLAVGIGSLKKTSSLKDEASTEENTTETIMAFLKECYPKEVVEKINKNQITGEEVTGEELYFLQMEEMKNHLIMDFPDADENYLDALLEEYYNSLGL